MKPRTSQEYGYGGLVDGVPTVDAIAFTAYSDKTIVFHPTPDGGVTITHAAARRIAKRLMKIVEEGES